METVKTNLVNCDVNNLEKDFESLKISRKKLKDMSPEELDICFYSILCETERPSRNCEVKNFDENFGNVNNFSVLRETSPKNFDIPDGPSGVSELNVATRLRSQPPQPRQSSSIFRKVCKELQINLAVHKSRKRKSTPVDDQRANINTNSDFSEKEKLEKKRKYPKLERENRDSEPY